jgi:hypothetical protein
LGVGGDCGEHEWRQTGCGKEGAQRNRGSA